MHLDQVVALPVVAVGAARLGVGERVAGDVGRAVRQPADGEGDPGLRVDALLVGRRGVQSGVRLLEEHERELVGAPVVEHVGPVERGVRERLRRTRS